MYLRGVTYSRTLLYDEYVRIHIPRDVASMIFDGSRDRYIDLWLMVRKTDGYVEIFEHGQRSIDDCILELSFMNPIVGLKSLRYRKGYRYCSSFREAFLIDSKYCLRCGSRLRSKPKRVYRVRVYQCN